MTLIFIHGWGSFPEVWAGQKEFFGKEYKVILPDISQAKNIKDAADIVCGALPRAGDYVLTGWSLGWLVVLELLKSFNLRPKAIISIASTARFTDDGYLGAGPTSVHLAKMIRDCKKDPKRAYIDFYKMILADTGKEALVKVNLPPFDYNNLIYGLDILKSADYRDFIETINIPALIITGSKDTICPKEASIYMHKIVKNSQLEMLDCGHMPFLSREQEFNNILESFIRAIELNRD